MKSLSGKILLLTTTIIGFAATTPAMAQSAPQDDASTIVVTARRVEERLQDVPISITVFTPEQLSNRNIFNSQDLATYTPSLATNSRFGPEKASFAIRGFTQEATTAPSVGVYFADVTAPRLNANLTSGNGAGVGSLFDLQNIQVLKGPQGTLFGRNTTGGAILLVPQKPTGNLEGYVEGTIGNYDARRIQAVVNVPVMDTLRIRLGIDRNTRDGWLRNRSGIGPADFNDVDYWAARFSMVADLTPNLENYTIVTFSESDVNGALGALRVFQSNAGPSGTPGAIGGGGRLVQAATGAQFNRQIALGYGYYDVESSLANPRQYQQQWQIINTTTWKASDALTIKNIVSYAEMREKTLTNISGDNIPTPFVQTYPGLEGPQGQQSTFTEELQFQGRTPDDRLTWQAGGYVELSNPLGQQSQWTAIYTACANIYALACSPTNAASSVSVSRNNFYYRNYGLYAQGSYKITDQLTLTAGARYTWDRSRATSNNVSFLFRTGAFICTQTGAVVASIANSPACTIGAGRNPVARSDKPTWLVDLEYKPIDDIMLFGKYTRGYRAGAVNPSNPGFESWEPEKVDTYEAGIKTTWRGAIRGTFNVTGFYNDFNNQQISTFIPGVPPNVGANAIVNVGKSRIWGVEADASLTLFTGFRLDASYAYLNTKLKSVRGVTACNPLFFQCAAIAPSTSPGQPLALSPKNRVTVTGTYTLPLDESIGKISLSATYTHTDSQFFSHADDAAFTRGFLTFYPGVTPFNPGLLPATDLLNLNVNWNSVAGSPVDLSLFATNVTKEKYWVAMTNGLSSTGGEFLYLGEPRMYGVRLRYRFGS